MNRANRILLVDDSPEDRELYRRYLEQDPSYTLYEAVSGQQGLELWQQFQPDAIVLDYALPDLNGLEFLATLPVAAHRPAVVMISGQTDMAIAIQAMKAGVQDYLEKQHLTPDQLRSAIQAAIEAVQSQAQLQQMIERERLVWQIIQKIQQSLDLGKILQTTVDEVRHFLQTDRVLIFQLASDGSGHVVAESVGAWQSLLSTTIYDPCLAKTGLSHNPSIPSAALTHDRQFAETYVKPYQQGQVSAIADIDNSGIAACHVELLAQFQVRANLVVPILHDQQCWGLLIAHHCAAPRSWQPFEIELLQQIASPLSIALRQAELYQQTQFELAERQQAETDLRISEERYTALARISPVGIFRTDVAGDCQYVNARWCELAGLTPAAAQGKGWVRAIHPDDRDRVSREWYEATTLNQPFYSEYRFQTPDGVVSWLVGQAIAEKDAAGSTIGYVGTITNITARKQAEQALQVSEERLRVALEASRMGTWDWNIQTGEISWSENLEALFGLAPGEFDGSLAMFSERLHPADRNRVLAAIDHAVATGEDYDIEFRVIYPNGKIRWALSQGKVFYDSKGQPVRMAGSDIDITDRKRAAEALRESEERFRQLTENIDAVFWLKEIPSTRTIYTSSAYERLWGFDPGELYVEAHAWFHHIHPDDLNKVAIAFETQALTGQFDQEYRIVLADGRIRWVRDRCFPLQDQTGAIHRLAGIAEDITDRKQTEEVLRQSEEFKDRLLASSPDCIKVLDIQGKLLYMNPNGLCLMEIEDFTPYLHLEWVSVWQGEYRLQAEQALAAAQAGESSLFRGFCPTAKGTPKWWEVIVSPIPNVAGQTEQILSVSRDITERKQVEVERERLLQQEQAARIEAERANRIKDEFLAILSHELRSPLNPILGWTKLLQTRKFDETRTAEALAAIERNAKLQTQLIDDLLDVAKILRGKLSIEMVPVNLSCVIEAAIDTVRASAAAKSILLHATLPQIGRILGDSARLQQIVWNLLSNAIKFTPAQGQVVIQLERVGNQAQITVSDTGKGINPDFLPHLFESFRQEDASITRRFGGLGLGLAIVQSLVETHGGTITANSPGEGQGATFIVKLPLLDTELEPRQPKALPVSNLNLSGIRILTVDDEPDARELINVLLTQYGAEVLTVTSAAEVLAALESFQPNILISDVGMPEMDGYSLMRQIRSLSTPSGSVAAIALTAYAREADQQRALDSGYQQHLTKPIEPEQLVKMVMELTLHEERVNSLNMQR